VRLAPRVSVTGAEQRRTWGSFFGHDGFIMA
jgi:hypothetical protein